MYGYSNTSSGPQRRKIHGTVTKLFENFGYVNDEIFFMKTVVSGRMVRLNDRVSVDALYQPNMPVKWNAERVTVEQDIRRPRNDSHSNRSTANSYRASSRTSSVAGGGGKRLVPGSSRSAVRAYVVHIPQRLFSLEEASVMDLKQRYPRLYIPSDFFHAALGWQELFPPHRQMRLGQHAAFHVMHKEVDPVVQVEDSDPTDHNYTYSAKVMLLSSPALSELFTRTCALAQDANDVRERFTHISRVLEFVCGTNSTKTSEPFALGGPWSPSLDGENPESDPQVLVNTAIRHVKRQAGLDLSTCSTWYRFLEVHYYRPARPEKQKEACTETVVMFLPDIWSLMPDADQWEQQEKDMEARVEGLINPPVPEPEEPEHVSLDEPLVVEEEAPADEADENEEAKTEEGDKSMNEETADDSKNEESEEATEENKGDATTLDIPNMKVADLRRELETRGKSSKGLKAQLVARLELAMSEEAAGGDKKTEEVVAVDASDDKQEDSIKVEEEKVEEVKPTALTDKEKERIKRIHSLPKKAAILVYPSRTAKGGKLELQTMTLNQLLSYRVDASKEHTFELSLFVEQFNEMLTRDFAFRIYSGLSSAKKEEVMEVTEEEPTEGEPAEKKVRSEDAGAVAPRKILRTVKPYLLLSCVYFDQQQAGYLLGKDVEDLIGTLGLFLSRSQIRKMLEQIGEKKSGDWQFKYRQLTDREVKSGEEQDYIENEDSSQLLKLVDGNRELLGGDSISQKVFVNQDAADTKLRLLEQYKSQAETQFNQCSAELSTLMKKLETVEEERAKTETEAVELREKVRTLRKEESGQRHLATDYRKMLRDTLDKVTRATAAATDMFDRERKEVERKLEEKKQQEEEERKKAEEANAKPEENGEGDEKDDTEKPADVEMKEGEWNVVDAV